MSKDEMTQRVVSPYGADAPREIREFLGIGTLEQFVAGVEQHLEHVYGLSDLSIERLHVAGAFAVTVATREGRFVFKIDEHEEEALAHLLDRINHLRRHGLPLAQVHPTSDGRLFGTPFSKPHAKAYLVEFMHGLPSMHWIDAHATATATFLARFHELGGHFTEQPGEKLTLQSLWTDLDDAVSRLHKAQVLAHDRLAFARHLLTRIPLSDGLVWTHVHGDARLCHFFFVGDQLTGVVDYDAGMWGQRVIDLAFHLISHPQHERVAFLSMPAIMAWLRQYHALYPLTDEERAALPPVLACALLMEMGETLWSIKTARAGLTPDDLADGLLLLDALSEMDTPII